MDSDQNNPLSAFLDPLFGNTFQQANPATQEEWEGIFRYAVEDLGLNHVGRTRLMQLMDAGATPEALLDEIPRLQQQQRDDLLRESVEADQERFLGMAREQIGGDVKRFGALVRDPGAIRSDVDYGRAISQAEGTINAAVEETRRAAAAANEQSGLRASGGAANAILNAQTTAAGQKAAFFGGLRSDVQDRFTDAQNRLLEVERGNVPTQASIGQIGSFAPGTALENITGLSMGAEQGQRGLFQQSFGQLVGAGQRSTDQALNFGQGLISSFRGN